MIIGDLNIHRCEKCGVLIDIRILQQNSEYDKSGNRINNNFDDCEDYVLITCPVCKGQTQIRDYDREDQ